MLNALTIDVEDYFQVQAFADISKYEDWDSHECRVERNTEKILEILGTAVPDGPVKATFFILGWIAERYPQLVKRIGEAGHEIACHGYAHQVIYRQTKEEFRSDIRKAKAILEEITGNEVIGYRAPSYSVTQQTIWAFNILAEEGFRYDSSIFPIHHDIYGIPDAPRFPFSISFNGRGDVNFMPLTHQPSPIDNHRILKEFPISTVQMYGLNMPVSGGGYFRFFPYALISMGLRRVNVIERQPFIFYLHPWEVDPDQPKMQGGGLRSQFRHRVNLTKTEIRFKRLLNDFQFTTVSEVLKDMLH